jgi:hypothetical protein
MAAQSIVKMPNVPARIHLPIQIQHPLPIALGNPARRSLAEPSIPQASLSLILKACPIASKLALRHSQQLEAANADNSEASQRLSTSLNFNILRSCSNAVRLIHDPSSDRASNRTTRVLTAGPRVEIERASRHRSPNIRNAHDLYCARLANHVDFTRETRQAGRR